MAPDLAGVPMALPPRSRRWPSREQGQNVAVFPLPVHTVAFVDGQVGLLEQQNGKLVGPLVLGLFGVALDPYKFHLVPAASGQQAFP